MSFTNQIKQELANIELADHCQRAQLSALLQLTSSLTISQGELGILVRSESPTTAKRTLFLLKKQYDVETNLRVAKKTNLKKNNVYTLNINSRGKEILRDLGIYNESGLTSHTSYEVVAKNCCCQAYLAGCFLAYGSCNDPGSKSYHLELSFEQLATAQFALRLLKRFKIIGKICERRKRYVLYLKKIDYISNFLALIGASNSMLELENSRIERDIYNANSRMNNCEIANEMKSIQAGMSQIADIEMIVESGDYLKLDEKLKNVADLRLENPDLSLLQLCEKYQKKYGESISKSGMKHRFVKLASIASGLEEK